MKTATQELLENLQKQFDEQTYPIRIDGTYFLQKEKEQIIKACEKFGNLNGVCIDDYEEYYNETYNQNK